MPVPAHAFKARALRATAMGVLLVPSACSLLISLDDLERSDVPVLDGGFTRDGAADGDSSRIHFDAGIEGDGGRGSLDGPKLVAPNRSIRCGSSTCGADSGSVCCLTASGNSPTCSASCPTSSSAEQQSMECDDSSDCAEVIGAVCCMDFAQTLVRRARCELDCTGPTKVVLCSKESGSRCPFPGQCASREPTNPFFGYTYCN